MPINELERHPFLNYLEEDNLLPDYQGLIIGSFPVHAVTDTLDQSLEISQRRLITEKAYMKFFYSSKRSQFWKYCSNALDPLHPVPVEARAGDLAENKYLLARQRSIDLLQQHKLLMTDAVYQTNRGGENGLGSEDSCLWITKGASQFVIDNLQLNHTISRILAQHTSIKNLYFTSTVKTKKSPFGWFKSIFGRQIQIGNWHQVGTRPWSAKCTIQGRAYNLFFLPTPKTRGFHFTDTSRTLMFVNYMRSRYPAFYEQIENVPEEDRTIEQIETISSLRNEALIESYRQALVHQNIHFDGTMPV